MLTINLYLRYKSTPMVKPPSTSSAQLEHVPDRNSTRITLQSCLECLNRLNDRIISVHREMLEIRIRIAEFLDTTQSGATVMDSSTRGSSAYPQAIFNEPDATLPLLTTPDLSGLPQPLAHGRFSDQEYCPLECIEIMGSLLEDTSPMVVYNRCFSLRRF